MLSRRPDLFDLDFCALSRRAPALAGDHAYRLFCTPRYSGRRSADHDILVRRARIHLQDAEAVSVVIPNQGYVRAYVFHPETDHVLATVVVVHGWTSEASFMTAIAEPMRRSGFRVVLFDCPAHGKSSGRQTSLIHCARATIVVTKYFEERYGPIPYVIAHSMGGLVSLLAASGGKPLPGVTDFRHFVLISPPNAFAEVTWEFARDLSLSAKAQRIYEHHLERISHRRLPTFTACNLLLGLGGYALLIHSRDDQEVPIHNSYQIAACCPHAVLEEFDQLGHRKILYAPPVIRSILGEFGRIVAVEDYCQSRLEAAPIASQP